MENEEQNLFRVRELSQRVCDGLADEETIAELESCLRKSSEARETYLRIMDLHFDLERKADRGTLAPPGPDRILENLASNTPTASTERPTLPWLISGIAAAVAILLVGSWWTLSSRSVATLSRSENVEWKDGRRPDDLKVGKNEWLILESGVAEVKTKLGVRIILEAPTAGRFTGSNTFILEHGKLFADVPPSGYGFTITTPTGKVVDYGTRFGIEISKISGETEVHVETGHVVAVLDVEGELQEKDLYGGEAARVSVNQIETTHLDLAKFARISGPYYEPFENWRKPSPDVGSQGWFASPEVFSSTSEEDRSFPTLNQKSLAYPWLESPQGRTLRIYQPRNSVLVPVERHWPHSYASMILMVDDDLPKTLRHTSLPHAPLLSFQSGGESSSSSEVSLILQSRKQSGGRRGEFFLGLTSGDSTGLSKEIFHGHEVFFVVFHWGESECSLWINPSPEAFEPGSPPPPQVVIPVETNQLPGALRIDTPGPNQKLFLEWWIDELRGGNNWEEVTPSVEE